MSAPVSEEGFHEVQLSGKQLVFLFMATTVVLVAIFLLGVVVGRDVGPERLVAEATGTTIEGLPPEQPSSPVEAGQPAAEPPTPAQETPDEFSYHERLQQAAAKPESVEPAPPQIPAASDPAAAAPAPASAPASGWVAQIGAYNDRATADRIVRTLTSKQYPAFVLPPAPGAPTAAFRVRVGPYRERREAEDVAGRLQRELQFKPFVTR